MRRRFVVCYRPLLENISAPTSIVRISKKNSWWLFSSIKPCKKISLWASCFFKMWPTCFPETLLTYHKPTPRRMRKPQPHGRRDMKPREVSLDKHIRCMEWKTISQYRRLWNGKPKESWCIGRPSRRYKEYALWHNSTAVWPTCILHMLVENMWRLAKITRTDTRFQFNQSIHHNHKNFR